MMHYSGNHRLLRSALIVILGIAACTTFSFDSAVARVRQGDRFGIRGGIWPQSDIIGTFGARRIYPDGDTLSIQINEEARVVPFIEAYAMFHLNGAWWAEGAIGWAGRNDVQVNGHQRGEGPILLGNGRVDFFPMFVGLRGVKTLGTEERPHNVYLRGGGSVVFANESPDLVQDSVLKYGVYTSGTEGAFGFLTGAGAEYYVGPNVALGVDASYRYTKYSYAREAKFDLSAFWLSFGITVKTR